MSDQDKAMQEKYTAQAQESFNAIVEQIRELAASNPETAESNKELLAGNGAYYSFGDAEFVTAISKGILNMNITYSSGEKIQFSGQHGGLGLGAGVSWGSMLLAVPAPELIGDAFYTAAGGGLVAGPTVITMWRGGQLLGGFSGASLTVAAFAVIGSGEWRTA
jgi:hypothetical protein